MTDKAAQLKGILTAFYADHQSNLHDGRSASRPDIDGYVRKIELLFALDEISLFEQVMTASERYVTRFEGTLTQEGALKKFTEESDEFYEAATDYTVYRNDYDAKVHKQKMLGECIDVMVTMGGVLSYFGVTWDELEQAANATLDKLGSRTTEHFTWDDKTKTVMKRSKLESAK